MLKISKAQILHLLSTFIIVPVAGFITAWVAKHFPGLPHFSKGEVSAFFMTGASSGLGLMLHYLHGWQLWERTIGRLVDVTDTTAKTPAGAPPLNPPGV